MNALALSLIATQAPDELQGRAASAGRQLAMVGAPFGPLVAGALVGALGATDAIGVYAIVLLGLAVIATGSRALRQRA